MSIPKSLETQVGGSHYTKYKVQPLEFSEKLQITSIIFCIFKYLVRYKDKNGVEDLRKALHCIDVFVECGKEKSVIVSTKDLDDFLAQFDNKQGEAILRCLFLQSNKAHAGMLRILIQDLLLELAYE